MPQIVNFGPLGEFEKKRNTILSDVVERTVQEYGRPEAVDFVLSEALFQERHRLAKSSNSKRIRADKTLWNQIRRGLLKKDGDASKLGLLTKAVAHYAEEIGGHFNRNVYKFSIRFVPWCFSWLLNAISLGSLWPWAMKKTLDSQLKISGEVELVRKLSKKGTILLVPTHQSNVDSIAIGYIISQIGLPPFAYGAGLNLFSNPILGFFMSNLGAYTVDRQKRNPLYISALKNYSARILREGVHTIFYPGGGRSRNGAVESHLKLGLLGTGLQAQIDNLKSGKPDHKIYVVPMTTSYHFVLEASSLIDEYLASRGGSRFIPVDGEDPWLMIRAVRFFWKLFAAESEVAVRLARPLDVFGNPVDDDGESVGPNGTKINIGAWLTTNGKLCADRDRDAQYTRDLGSAIVKSYFKENTILSSHLVAFAAFRALRRKNSKLELYHFLRLPEPERTLTHKELMKEAEMLLDEVRLLHNQKELYLLKELRECKDLKWVKDGVRKLGLFHTHSILKSTDGHFVVTDMKAEIIKLT